MSHASVRRWLIENTPLEHSLLEGASFQAHVSERSAGRSEAEYIAALNGSPAELDRLIEGIAVPETWLFRYPRAFDLLLEFLRQRFASGATSLRMISVGCAAGQEAYSMAMTAIHAGWPADRITIDALDRNAEVLRIAAIAEYSASSIRSEIPGWATGFLQRAGEAICIDPDVRSLVRFSRAEASDPEVMRAMAPCDVIFCRNLLIYLSASARASLMESFAAALVPGGLLFTGHAEQMIRGWSGFRSYPAPHAFALERIAPQAPGAAPSRPAHAAVATPSASPRHNQPAQVATTARSLRSPALERSSERSLDDARELADAGRTQEAESLVRSILARVPASAEGYELLALIRMASGDSTAAKRLFEQAVYLEPTRSTSLLQLAIITERAGESHKAATLWDRARRAAADAPQERRA